MDLKNYSLLEIIRPRLSEKTYRELYREIEWREQQKMLKRLYLKKKLAEEVKYEDF